MNDKRISITLTSAEFAEFQQLANKMDRSIAWIFRTAAREYHQRSGVVAPQNTAKKDAEWLKAQVAKAEAAARINPLGPPATPAPSPTVVPKLAQAPFEPALPIIDGAKKRHNDPDDPFMHCRTRDGKLCFKKPEEVEIYLKGYYDDIPKDEQYLFFHRISDWEPWYETVEELKAGYFKWLRECEEKKRRQAEERSRRQPLAIVPPPVTMPKAPIATRTDLGTHPPTPLVDTYVFITREEALAFSRKTWPDWDANNQDGIGDFMFENPGQPKDLQAIEIAYKKDIAVAEETDPPGYAEKMAEFKRKTEEMNSAALNAAGGADGAPEEQSAGQPEAATPADPIAPMSQVHTSQVPTLAKPIAADSKLTPVSAEPNADSAKPRRLKHKIRSKWETVILAEWPDLNDDPDSRNDLVDFALKNDGKFETMEELCAAYNAAEQLAPA